MRPAARIPILLLLPLTALPLRAQEWVAGVEGTSDSTYSYITHYSRRGEIIIWQTVSYLSYRTRENGGETQVNSPGVSAGVMKRWSQADRSFGVGTGYEFRWTERQPAAGIPEDITEQGILVEADYIQRFGARNSARLGGRWSASNNWTSVTADHRYEFSRSFRAGPQVLYNGNEDIRAFAAGVVAEIPIGPKPPQGTALVFRAGQARIEYRDGSTENEPYFSAGIVVPF